MSERFSGTTEPISECTRAEFDSVTDAVVTAVAEAKGVEPMDLDPLYETIDLEALEQLFEGVPGAPPQCRLSFEVDRLTVVVDAVDGVRVFGSATDSDGGLAVSSAD